MVKSLGHLLLQQSKLISQLPCQWSVLTNFVDIDLSCHDQIVSIAARWSNTRSLNQLNLEGNGVSGGQATTMDATCRGSRLGCTEVNVVASFRGFSAEGFCQGSM